MSDRYLVLKDTREKEGKGWFFEPSSSCQGTISKKLDSGDYTIEGFENKIVIERKGSLSEYVTNLFDARFYRELDRLESYELSIIICEFNFVDIMNWPWGHLPRKQAALCRTNPNLIIKKIAEIETKYKTRQLFLGNQGKLYTSSLFKRVLEKQ
jgi:hypothetical protein